MRLGLFLLTCLLYVYNLGSSTLDLTRHLFPYTLKSFYEYLAI